jgi:hypothetical protein
MCSLWQGTLSIVFSLVDKLATVIPPSPSILPSWEVVVGVVVLESTKVGALQCNTMWEVVVWCAIEFVVDHGNLRR